MSRRWRATVSGPLAPYAAGFAEELVALGYSKSAAKKQMILLAHLDGWLKARGHEAGEVTADLVEPLFAARRHEGRSNLLTTKSLKPFLGFLRRAGVAEPPRVVSVDPLELMIDRYQLYLAQERGLVEGSVHFYVLVARLFLSERRVIADLVDLGAADVIQLTGRVCEGRGLSSARQAVSALRSLLRWLQMEGWTGPGLDQAVLSVAGWSPNLPRAIGAGQAAQLLRSCDRRRALGRRDYAILTLLVRLGLRGGEVVGLELDDLDWRRGEILVRGKGRRQDRLPLPSDVGEALAGYLQRGRPQSTSRRFFLRHQAPFVGFSDTGAIRGVLGRACARAGLAYASPHRLRHTTATEMLRAGAPLSEIAQVLRHRSPTTTSLYAKVDNVRLAELARPWPGAV
ncbi:MAG: site-specific integrase [Acidimicrobiales bacterium]|jgi:site-specific recombinase XerD